MPGSSMTLPIASRKAGVAEEQLGANFGHVIFLNICHFCQFTPRMAASSLTLELEPLPRQCWTEVPLNLAAAQPEGRRRGFFFVLSE